MTNSASMNSDGALKNSSNMVEMENLLPDQKKLAAFHIDRQKIVICGKNSSTACPAPAIYGKCPGSATIFNPPEDINGAHFVSADITASYMSTSMCTHEIASTSGGISSVMMFDFLNFWV